jgi:dUTP pyrophosphatase
VKFVRTHENAIISKANLTDTGFDLNLVDVKKQVGDVIFFGTGIKVQPSPGYYFKVEPRSSISKTNYMLANGVGNIDEGYTGEIIVPLRKMKPDAEPLELPRRLVQLVLYKRVDCLFEQVDSLEDTSRGDGGFGSTGK